jgi:hypothetical protein
MNSVLIPLLIFCSAADDVAERREAVRVYHCDFEDAADKNYDRWPDEWTRRRGRGYPVYLPIEIREDTLGSRPSPRHCLRVELDGGAALVYSPAIEVNPLFSYFLQVFVRTERLKHNAAFCGVTLLDADKRPLETVLSEPIKGIGEWTKVAVGPITPTDSEARWAMIELHLNPGEESDLVGAAVFDDIWFGRLPRVGISTNSPFNVFTDSSQIEVRCRVSGISDREPKLQFELIDIDDHILETAQVPVEIDPAASISGEAALRSRLAGLAPQRIEAFSGTAVWRAPIVENGFYQIRASIPNHTGLMIERTVKLVVVDPQPQIRQGEFGWSLPDGDRLVSIRELPDLLSEVGIHWVKFPVWYSDDDSSRADELAWFTERLSASSIELVGLLDHPPEHVRKIFGERPNLPVASVFVEPEIWHPAVNPVMTRLSLKVRWWQLGADRDTSFVNFPDLEQKLGNIRRELNRFGQEINVGIAWSSIDESPAAKAPPWSFLSHVAEPPLTSAEIRSYFAEPSPAQRWLLVEPIARDKCDLSTRAKDLVLRMVAAKMEGVGGIFVPNPFDAKHGLMEPDGMPGELLLAWRTTATMISGATHLGMLQLPQQFPVASEVFCFSVKNAAITAGVS